MSYGGIIYVLCVVALFGTSQDLAFKAKQAADKAAMKKAAEALKGKKK